MSEDYSVETLKKALQIAWSALLYYERGGGSIPEDTYLLPAGTPRLFDFETGLAEGMTTGKKARDARIEIYKLIYPKQSLGKGHFICAYCQTGKTKEEIDDMRVNGMLTPGWCGGCSNGP